MITHQYNNVTNNKLHISIDVYYMEDVYKRQVHILQLLSCLHDFKPFVEILFQLALVIPVPFITSYPFTYVYVKLRKGIKQIKWFTIQDYSELFCTQKAVWEFSLFESLYSKNS